MPSTANSIKVLGIRVDEVNWAELLDLCRRIISQEDNPLKQIITLNGEFVLEAQKNRQFRNVINQADLVVADSTNIVWAARLRGSKSVNLTPGSDLTEKLCQIASEMEKKVYFLGGQKGVAKKAAEVLKQKYPELRVVGVNHADPNDPNLIKQVNFAQADLLLVAYGAPKQEIWIASHKKDLNVKLAVGVGGTFDMLAGVFPRAPQWMRSAHLEWFWRLFIQPRRIGRIFKAVVVFPLKVIFSR